jgi:PAS domain S-box-containing protein
LLSAAARSSSVPCNVEAPSPFFMALIKKLVLAFLLVSMVPLGAIIGVLHYTFVEHAEGQVGARLEDSVIQRGKSVDEFMFSCIRGMQDLAKDSELSSGDSAAILKHLSRYIHSFRYFGEVMLVDAQGMVIASSSPPEVGTSLFTRFDDTWHEFEQALHSSAGVVYISDLNEIPEPLRRVAAAGKLRDVDLDIQMLTAVQDAAGHTTGVLVSDIVTDPLRVSLEDLKRRAPGDGSACLLDKGGLVLMTTDAQATLLSPHPDVPGGALRAPLGQNASGYLVYRSAHGRQKMAAYSRLRAYGASQACEWRLVTLASYDAILAPVTESFNRTLGILFATLVGAVGLGLWLARRLAGPILKITESAKTIAAGRFDARVAVTTRDEIGTLAEAFNLLAGTLQTEITQRAQAQESLRGANEELEQRVEERTAQLTAEIAERTRAEKELHQLHHQHELVLNAVGEGIYALDLDGQIIFENPAGEKMLGWESSELIGKPAHATMHHSKAGGAPYPHGECPILATLGDGTPRRISDEVFWRKDGTSFPVEYVTTPLRDENHEIIGAVVVFSDITESKRAERELHHAKEPPKLQTRPRASSWPI